MARDFQVKEINAKKRVTSHNEGMPFNATVTKKQNLLR